MSTQFYHRADHAVAQFTGDLTLEAAIDLVNAVDALVDVYFYRRIEIQISSPGGLVQSIDHLALAVERWRAQGVRICTRVSTSAYSAGAVLFSIGDERVVEPTARLLYHGARLQQNGFLNRSDTVTLFTTISRLDASLLTLLTARALRDSDEPERIAAAEEPDEPALVALVEVLPDPDRAWPVGDDRVGELAQVVGHYVNRAVRDGDYEALVAVYSALLDHGGGISASLAVTLRLADRVGSAEPSQVRCDGEAPSCASLLVPEWTALFAPDGAVPRDVLTRHVLILGETGSGKTASAILPIVAAIARAPRERVGAALVVDPKRELCRILQAIAGPRVCHLDPGRLVLDLMCSPRWRLDDDLAAGRWFTAASQILLRVRSFLPASPLRVLGPHEVGNANNEFFDREGVALLLDVLAFLLLLLDARTPPPEEWLGDDPFAPPRLWVESFLERARGAAGERGPNVVALASWALAGPLVAVCPNPSESCLFGDIATAALAAWEPEPGEALDLLVRACTYWPCSAAIDRQHAGVVGVARGVCDELASPAIARAIYFGVEPGYVVGADASSTVDFERLVACAGGSRDPAIVVYQPSRDGADAIIAAALKAIFFEAVLDNPDRQRGGPDLPLVAYVADQAHRFVPTHGDQSFFEISRSHGAFVVLAAPSIASFEHALVQRGGTQTQNATSVSMLWVNTANKLFFRSSDGRTADRLDALCPRVPGLSSLTQVRPVSMLGTGTCYALLADGRFERRQLEPFEFASCVLPRALEPLEPAVAPEPEPASESERVPSPPVLEADATISRPWRRRRWSLSRGFGFSRRRFGPRFGGPGDPS